MFEDLKIDKLRLSYKKEETTTINQITERLKKSFHKACTYSKMNDVYHSITPTKLIRKLDVFHNLQMPREKKVLKALKKSFVNEQNTKVTEIHLTKDILLSENPDEYIDLIAGMKLSSLIPVCYSSNAEGKSVYLVPPKREIDDEEYTGNFIIKFYNKTQEYLLHNDSPIVQLNEYLNRKERSLAGEAYNVKENTLDISKLNILRIEIVFKTSKALMPVINSLLGKSEANELSLTSILDKLRTESLYGALDETFNQTLKKYVFNQVCKAKDFIGEFDRIKALAVDCLAQSDEYYHYKSIFTDIGMKNQFSELQTLVRKIRPESELYNELYYKLFGASLNIKSGRSEEKEELKIPCKGYGSLNTKNFLLVYEVMIWDDS